MVLVLLYNLLLFRSRKNTIYCIFIYIGLLGEGKEGKKRVVVAFLKSPKMLWLLGFPGFYLKATLSFCI